MRRGRISRNTTEVFILQKKKNKDRRRIYCPFIYSLRIYSHLNFLALQRQHRGCVEEHQHREREREKENNPIGITAALCCNAIAVAIVTNFKIKMAPRFKCSLLSIRMSDIYVHVCTVIHEYAFRALTQSNFQKLRRINAF